MHTGAQMSSFWITVLTLRQKYEFCSRNTIHFNT